MPEIKCKQISTEEGEEENELTGGSFIFVQNSISDKKSCLNYVTLIRGRGTRMRNKRDAESGKYLIKNALHSIWVNTPPKLHSRGKLNDVFHCECVSIAAAEQCGTRCVAGESATLDSSVDQLEWATCIARSPTDATSWHGAAANTLNWPVSLSSFLSLSLSLSVLLPLWRIRSIINCMAL